MKKLTLCYWATLELDSELILGLGEVRNVLVPPSYIDQEIINEVKSIILKNKYFSSSRNSAQMDIINKQEDISQFIDGGDLRFIKKHGWGLRVDKRRIKKSDSCIEVVDLDQTVLPRTFFKMTLNNDETPIDQITKYVNNIFSNAINTTNAPWNQQQLGLGLAEKIICHNRLLGAVR